ncbi:peptidoglycan-binding protein [Candidatus Accumulibacter phosphatis]|uniref:Peptidoglycan-binding protein n=1 Tax=Candidatus Accumulibacter phosphatis TaxID=327160 RepID=A0ABX1TZV6_9PROT|nr:peptidoglycan-binding domain-containing protein [Candidatus Accumulibacter phosphatis]NMQ29791.1 peptidoglycan-binding protein [Candidatus Accumulibacter phosphatis]
MALAAVAPLGILLKFKDSFVYGPFDWPRFGSWFCCLAGILGLFVLAGLKIRGRVFGVLIDERNRYALSRLQITLWTVLVLATVYVVFVANIVRGSAGESLNVNLDLNLVALMGLSVASFVTAPMALSYKASQPGDAGELARTGQQLRDAQSLDAIPSATGRVLTKNSPNDARLADLIRGEDIGNANVVDLPRLQMLLITAVVVLAYGGVVGHTLGTGTLLLKALPVLSNTVLMLVLVSHGGYVAGKLIPTNSSAVSPQYATRALQASQRAASLAADLQAQLNTTAPGDPRYGWLRGSLALAQGVAAEAAALPSRFAVADFKPEEISNIEGRVDALRASLGAQPDAPSVRQMYDAPSTETVSKLQQRLYALGHADVRVTGVADVATEQAIRDSLAQLGVKREDLHPRPFRYYEEIVQLI